MSVREYVGARYVPIVVGEWDNTKTYEPLMVVTYQGNSYTSRQYVPTGIEITNESYWILSANYNAQVDAYRNEVTQFDGRIDANATANAEHTNQLAGTTDSGLKTLVNAEHTTNVTQDAQIAGTADSGLKTLITNESTARGTKDTALDAQLAGTTDSGLKTLIDANTTANAAENTRAVGEENNLSNELNTIKYKDQYPIILSYSNYGSSAGNIKLYCSYDFINFMDCGLVKDENNNNIYADAKNVCLTNDKLYLIGSGVVYKATDNLKNFIKVANLGANIQNATGLAYAWGISLYYDTDSDSLYVYGGCSNTDSGNFSIYGCRVDTETLAFINTPVKINITGYDNVIDPFVIKHNNVLYMAFKDETNKKIHIATGTAPLDTFTPNDGMFSHFGSGFEAPKLIEIDNNLIMFADGYGVRADGNTRPYDSANDVGYFRCNGWFNVETNALCNIINFSRDIYTKSFMQFSNARHPCYLKLNTFVKNLFNNTDINPIMVKCKDPYAYIDVATDDTTAKYIITNAPMLYRVTGGHNITVGYNAVFNQNCVTYIENAQGPTYKISIDSSFFGGADSGRYICNEDREICSIISQANVAFPNHIYYS